jgi:uncharacterized protein YodC (DUF2158 family)
MPDFKPGDTVRLKSGGSIMTVEDVGEDEIYGESVYCVWEEKIGQRKEVKRERFKPVVLEKAKAGVATFSVGRA